MDHLLRAGKQGGNAEADTLSNPSHTKCSWGILMATPFYLFYK